MVNLSVNFAGIELKNPLVVASSDNVRDIRQIRKAEEYGASAVIVKTLFPNDSVALQTKLRCYIDAKEGARYGSTGAKRISSEQALELLKVAKKESKIRIGISIPFFRPGDDEWCAYTAKRMMNAGADFVELNFSPQHPSHLEGMKKVEELVADPEKEVQKIIQDLPIWIAEATKTVKEAIKIPVITKISPMRTDVVAVAKAMERGGADAIDAINGMGGAFKVDIFDGGRPKLPTGSICFGGCTGAHLKPFAQGFVAQISKAVNVPVMGTGGIMNWNDAVEMMMFGATTVSFCTLLMIHGFEAITQIEKGLREFMEQQGYNDVADFKGAALPYFAASQVDCEIIPSVAKVNKERCTGCGICLRPAHCLATYMEDGKAKVNETDCQGCGTCFWLCPVEAISMIAL
jgi:dihydroorotate dehydrogenase/Pyruvate/2-oxoacid:ferredoxin oxidoreductase delta subunit